MQRWAVVGLVCLCGLPPLGRVHAADIPANPVDLAGPLARARTAYLSGRYAEADALYAAAIGLREGDGAREEPDAAGEAWLARPLYELGTVRKLEGRCEEASNLLRRSIRISSAAPNPDPAELSRAWEVLGTAFDCRARYQDSQHAYSQALNLEDGMAAPDPKRQVQILSGLAVAYQYLGRHGDSDGCSIAFRIAETRQDRPLSARSSAEQPGYAAPTAGTPAGSGSGLSRGPRRCGQESLTGRIQGSDRLPAEQPGRGDSGSQGIPGGRAAAGTFDGPDRRRSGGSSRGRAPTDAELCHLPGKDGAENGCPPSVG